jgi:hypothetical protein
VIDRPILKVIDRPILKQDLNAIGEQRVLNARRFKIIHGVLAATSLSFAAMEGLKATGTIDLRLDGLSEGASRTAHAIGCGVATLAALSFGAASRSSARREREWSNWINPNS